MFGPVPVSASKLQYEDEPVKVPHKVTRSLYLALMIIVLIVTAAMSVWHPF